MACCLFRRVPDFKDFTFAEIDNRAAIAYCGHADATIDAELNPGISRMAERTVAESPELGDADATMEADNDMRSEGSGNTTICDSPLVNKHSTDLMDEDALSLVHSPPDVREQDAYVKGVSSLDGHPERGGKIARLH